MNDTSNCDILVVGKPAKDGGPPDPPKAESGTSPKPNPDPKLNGKYTPGWLSGTCVCAKNGRCGGNGNDATPSAKKGGVGGAAPTFALIVARLASDFSVYSKGAMGGKGEKGQDGGDGGDGQDAGKNDEHCVGDTDDACCKPALGGVGGKAGNGANAGEGGPGGDGGDVYIYYTQRQTPNCDGVVFSLQATSYYGVGGPTGDVGKKGTPGKGGKNEQVHGLTIPPNADSGAAGRDGLPTSRGEIGNPGNVYTRSLYTDKPI
jgi:hypothetical protein